ncbi:MAG: aldo/keto reductase [Casimicrobiaceae bacterium]
MNTPRSPTRRRLLGAAVAAAAMTASTGRADVGAGAPARQPIRRPVPITGELVPSIGMGTWITFDAGAMQAARQQRLPVLQAFFDGGGAVIDSSPMYGTAESVVGELLPQVRARGPLFAATKVWTPGRLLGVLQMERSRQLWGVPHLDLIQIHNMLDWETHLDTLKAMKTDGRIRYLGITTSHGSRHDAIARALTSEAFDFVQFTYNLAHRQVEARLLPLAAERRVAVIINRPFDGGNLFGAVRGRPLPAYAREIDCMAWSQLFLKFVIAHPAVTCAIPATSNPLHMVENMRALHDPLPDAALRVRMARDFDAM